jgi:hypothetical protein
MKRWLPAILLVCALGGVVWYFFIAPPGKSKTTANPGQNESPGTVPGTPLSGPRTSAAASTTASSDGEPTPSEGADSTSANSPPPPVKPFILGSADSPPGMDAATVLSNMRITVNQHGSMFGGNPVGTNPEITKALNGDNPKQARFIKEELGLRINGRGELVDYWGTPFFFHQLSGTEMELHSAGPDKAMWTADDLVTK